MTEATHTVMRTTWPGPARLDDAVSTFRCTPEGRAWQRQNFAAVLHVLSRDGADSGKERAVGALLAKAAPDGLQPEAYEGLVRLFVAEMQLGVGHRRLFLNKLLSLHEPRAALSLHDARVPLVLPLFAEFETALAGLEPQLRTMFVDDLRTVTPLPQIRQLAALA